jgi:ubiquinone/menaquinone biosynthesis C-methylase UbiE
MIWLWLGLACAAVVALVYWQLIVAEGTYLGPRVVAWTYDWVARRYDAIKQFDPRDENWFVAGPVMRELWGLDQPLVLDVATGTGRLPLALLHNRFRGQIVGLDLSRGMLRQARAKLQPYGDQVSLIWQDASRLPFADGTFDAVTCLESLEFMPRPLEALAEMVRVLGPGGLLFVTNRVGREARLLPGRAISRPRFEQVLASFLLCGVDVRRWQVSYDLAMARKAGQEKMKERGSLETK